MLGAQSDTDADERRGVDALGVADEVCRCDDGGSVMETKLGQDVLCHRTQMNDWLHRFREKRVKGEKLKVGVFGLTGCAGCQLTILFAEKFPALMGMIDILSIPFIKEQNHEGRFDLIILEGLVANTKDKKKAEEYRGRCDVLLCLGACAVHGCVPAMKNFMDHPEVEKAVYAKVDYLNGLAATPVSTHVSVDVELPGCPPDANQIYAVLTDLVLGRPPRITHNPVCVECVKREVDCLLMKGKPCLGPITTGGCDAICTAAGHECMGCRGPSEDANLVAYIDLLISKGYKREDIEKRLHTYAGLAVEARRKAERDAAPQMTPQAEPRDAAMRQATTSDAKERVAHDGAKRVEGKRRDAEDAAAPSRGGCC